jgi:hypothetical protein
VPNQYGPKVDSRVPSSRFKNEGTMNEDPRHKQSKMEIDISHTIVVVAAKVLVAMFVN